MFNGFSKKVNFKNSPANSSNHSDVDLDSSTTKDELIPPQLDPRCLLGIFKYLSSRDLERCTMVCRDWTICLNNPKLWTTLDASHSQMIPERLIAIVRRQPKTLFLNWSNIQPKQLLWLMARLPQLRSISLHGCPWANISTLHSCVCPPLHTLDLSFVSGLTDKSIHDLLSAPSDSRPGLTETKSRLVHLHILKLAGSTITDLSLKYISQQLPELEELDVSSCSRVTDAGVCYLSTPPAFTVKMLRHLNLATCKLITDLSLEHLQGCEALVRLDLRHGGQGITQASVARFAVRSPHNLYVRDIRLILQRDKKI